MYTVLLDATKAFDRVNYCKLFRKLLDRNMFPLVLRLLLYMYTNQSLQVRCGSHISTRFNVQNGVKQVGVLSPILFSVYIDGLFTRLSNSGIGCYIGNHFAGGVGFADDNKILSPSNRGLQLMIHICEDYTKEFDVTFNGAKSQCMGLRGWDCQEVTTCEIIIKYIPLNNANKAVGLDHTRSTEKSLVLYLLPLLSSRVVLIFSNLALVIFFHKCNVNFLNNTVAVSMVYPYGCYLVKV